ncbi:hypothetical protein PVK06_017833 [Gossypium arboreum]|uniref:Uncharacterized protein n=1 Tax=Gossypium arboreum TaxID=29729 RepID=A0ABR0Q3R0_GOSAR|nr:hypothetical protein PVK06_017833 [Gossypium arboreum]
MNHMERAKREEAAPLIEAAFQRQLLEEKVLHEREQQVEVELSRQHHDGDLKEKNRLARMLENYSGLEAGKGYQEEENILCEGVCWNSQFGIQRLSTKTGAASIYCGFWESYALAFSNVLASKRKLQGNKQFKIWRKWREKEKNLNNCYWQKRYERM